LLSLPVRFARVSVLRIVIRMEGGNEQVYLNSCQEGIYIPL